MQNYSFLQILLHDIILKNKFIKKSFYELEKIIFLRKHNLKNEKQAHWIN